MAPRTTGVEVACELFEVGMRLVEQRFRREHPDATEADVALRLREWMLDRPGAPDGDSFGEPRPVGSIAE